MEMNTRLQVEHPVTEEITGVDLVEWQLRVASGEPLPKRQDELSINGWAIEARLYAEDPAKGFLPSTGRLEHFMSPLTFDDTLGRIDAGVEEGDTISPFYDPMIAKVIAHRPSRAEAIGALADLLGGLEIWPVRTNAGFLWNSLREHDFKEAKLDTGFIGDRLAALVPDNMPDEEIWQAAACFAGDYPAPDESLPIGFRLNAPPAKSVTLSHAGETKTLVGERLLPHASGYTDEEHILVFEHGQVFAFDRTSRGTGQASAADGAIIAPMPGKVIAVDVSEGQTVTAGQRLLVLEAMKMEHALTAPFDGVIEGLMVSAGGQVQVEAVLCRVVPASE
jgi:3-methylcrotonyl-CoA carboxylase alpha subunit